MIYVEFGNVSMQENSDERKVYIYKTYAMKLLMEILRYQRYETDKETKLQLDRIYVEANKICVNGQIMKPYSKCFGFLLLPWTII